LTVLDALDSVYGNDEMPPGALSTGEPLDGLILTLLSQNTNDRNRDTAYDALRARYSAWEDVASLTPAEIAALIRPAGLGDTKSVRMKAILERIRSDFGAYSLSSLSGWSPGDVRQYLSNLPGIGPKTVACVMVFDLGMPAFPVDTHVARVSRRLGWVGERTVPEKIQEYLESAVPPERCAGGHLNMIEHGRAVCGARHPRCGDCAVVSLCERAGVSED
jgi:endonuclease-3